MTQTADPEAIARAGVAAWRAGDAQGARRQFEQVAAMGRATPQLWLLLAQARGACADPTGSEAALDHVLSADARNLHALTMKGEAVLARGDERGAVAYFELALTNAPPGTQSPPDLIERLRRAEQAVAAASERFRTHLMQALGDRGRGIARFEEAIGIATREQQVHPQMPTSFYYPRLAAIPFFEPSDFAWVAAIEAQVPAMRAELEGVMAQGGGFNPYVEAVAGRPNRGHALLDDDSWSAFHLWRDGELSANAARCPVTVAAVESAPVPRIAGRSPMVLFSILSGGTHIPAHNGMLNTRLICHIPLIVPADCRLRVGNETRTVEAGRAMIFDDSIEHEAWNDSEETRVVLLFEIWRPELDAAERQALTTMYEAIGTYDSAASERSR